MSRDYGRLTWLKSVCRSGSAINFNIRNLVLKDYILVTTFFAILDMFNWILTDIFYKVRWDLAEFGHINEEHFPKWIWDMFFCKTSW